MPSIASVAQPMLLADPWRTSLKGMGAKSELQAVDIHGQHQITFHGRGLEAVKRDIAPRELDTLVVALGPALSSVL